MELGVLISNVPCESVTSRHRYPPPVHALDELHQSHTILAHALAHWIAQDVKRV